MSSTGAIVCCEDGAVCFLEISEHRQELKLIKQLELSISSAAVSVQGDRIWFGGSNLRFSELRVSDLTRSSTSMIPVNPSSRVLELNSVPFNDQQLPSSTDASITGVGVIAEKLVYLDSKKCIRTRDIAPLTGGSERSLPHKILAAAHSEPVEGVHLMKDTTSDLAFYTWSREGSVHFWDSAGSLRRSEIIQLETSPADDEDQINELKCLSTSPSDKFMVSGDRLGVVR